MVVFLDIDNTLVDLSGNIPLSTVRACKAAQENGHKVLLCTGRSLCEIYPKLREMNFDGLVGGAGTYVELQQQVLADHPMQEEDVTKIRKYLDTNHIKYILQTNTAMYGEKEVLDGLVEMFQRSGVSTGGVSEMMQQVFKEINKNEQIKRVNKFMYIDSTIPFEQVESSLKGYRVLPNSIGSGDGSSGEISDLEINKATGMQIVQKHLNLDREDLLAVGDGSNDLEMVSYAGVGVAMGNASEQLKEVADYVTADIHEDGIYKCFQHFHLI